MSNPARIVGKVSYREGDGPTIVIRPGPCEVTETDQDVTISWTDGDTHGSTAIPLSDFKRYVAKKDIVLLE
jgi:hypothetical protein